MSATLRQSQRSPMRIKFHLLWTIHLQPRICSGRSNTAQTLLFILQQNSLADMEPQSAVSSSTVENLTGRHPVSSLPSRNRTRAITESVFHRQQAVSYTHLHKAIINIPTTVQIAMPHVFACQIEYIHKHLKYRDNVILSVHPHNDRGCGISDAEFGVLAGADRVEGTLFGNGERTGNCLLYTSRCV